MIMNFLFYDFYVFHGKIDDNSCRKCVIFHKEIKLVLIIDLVRKSLAIEQEIYLDIRNYIECIFH